MPVKTVTILVQAMTDRANAQVRATSAVFDELRRKSPVEMQVKLDKAQALAESRILAREMSKTVTDVVKLDVDRGAFGTGLAGILRRALLGGGTTAISLPAGLTIASLPALTTGILGIVPALVAAGAGVAAFGALAIPTFTAVSGAISGVSAANAKFKEAAQNVDIAITTSHADLVLYNAALKAMPANLASAARLLGNQNVTWQNLTASQQNNIIALSQNKSALSSLLPAQRTALSQLLASKAVWDQLSPAQQKVAIGWQNVSSAFQAMAAKLEPTVLSIMASGLQAINKVLPSILPLAQAAGKALGGLFSSLDKAVASKGFSDFIRQLTALSGPAITAIGTGIGQIAAAAGKLLLSMASPTALRDLRVFFEILAGAITGLADFLSFATPRWNNNIRSMTNFARAVRQVFGDLRQWIYDDFILRMVKFFTVTVPTAFDVWKENVRITFDKVKILALDTVLSITTTFGHLPGPLGAPFRAASTDIRKQLATIQADAASAAANINADWDKLHGKKVTLAWQIAGPSGNIGSAPPHAAGGLIRGGIPGRDSVLGMLMPGEVIVPASMVRAGAVDHLRGRLPGFGAGGTVAQFYGQFPSAGQIWASEGAVQNAFDSAFAAWARKAQARMPAPPVFPGGPGGGAPSANAALARAMFPQWATGQLWGAWNYVAMAESGWNQFARNPSSGAYGIPQALPPTKMPFAAQAAGGSNPAAQIAWMAAYMSSVYGGPAGAAQHEAAFHWYDRGGSLAPGLTLALNRSGRAESVLGSRAEALLEELIGAVQENTDVLGGLLAAAPARTGAGLGAALAMGGRSAVYSSLYP